MICKDCNRDIESTSILTLYEWTVINSSVLCSDCQSMNEAQSLKARDITDADLVGIYGIMKAQPIVPCKYIYKNKIIVGCNGYYHYAGRKYTSLEDIE